MAASDIPIVREALERLRQGAKITRSQRAALARVDRIVGARLPLSEYKPRTQRRYLAAAEVGANARTANRIDYEQKVAKRRGTIVGGPTQSYRDRIIHQANANAAALGEAGNLGQFDEDQIEELILFLGLRGALSVLRMQWDSIKEYIKNNSDPGNKRWYQRPDIVERFRKSDEYTEEFAVPYFWYHGRK